MRTEEGAPDKRFVLLAELTHARRGHPPLSLLPIRDNDEDGRTRTERERRRDR